MVLASVPRADVVRAQRPGAYIKGDPIITPHRLEKSRARAPEQRGAERLAKWLGLPPDDRGNWAIFFACEAQRDGHLLADAKAAL
jgi:hypothetical protein